MSCLRRHPLVIVLLGSGACWAALLLTVPPSRQEFALVDDWAFAAGVFRFARGEGIHYYNWAAMPQLGQWLWAVPFVWLGGESFVVLRVSTILLSWLGLWAYYDLLRGAEFSARQAAFLTATLAAFPLYLLLQGTFMTDVPSLSLSLIALALYHRALAAGRLAPAVAAAVVAGLGVMTRQNTVAVPLTAALFLAYVPGIRWRPAWWTTIAVPLGLAVVVHLWFEARPDVTPAKPDLPNPDELLLAPFLISHFCGLAVIPILALARVPTSWKRYGWMLLFMGGWAVYWWLLSTSPSAGRQYLPHGGVFPYCETVLTVWGIFPYLVEGDGPLLIHDAIRVTVTVVGCLAGAGLLVQGWNGGKLGLRPRLLLVFALLQIPLILAAPKTFDRYLLFLVPAALPLALGGPRQADDRFAWRPGLIALGAVLALSIGMMHDWLSWNAARWELGRRALDRGIPAARIEGGFAWNGWYAPEDRPHIRTRQPKGIVLPFTEHFAPHVTGEYALSFSDLEGTRIEDQEPYVLWLVPGRYDFLLLHWEAPSRHARAGSPK